jgi:hypothetical protein
MLQIMRDSPLRKKLSRRFSPEQVHPNLGGMAHARVAMLW